MESLNQGMLAVELHNSGRAAVVAGKVVNKVPGQPFYEWDHLIPEAREGRMLQARYLLERFDVLPKKPAGGPQVPNEGPSIDVFNTVPCSCMRPHDCDWCCGSGRLTPLVQTIKDGRNDVTGGVVVSHAKPPVVAATKDGGGKPAQVPSVGRIVHYVSYGTPGGEYLQDHRAAIITEVWAHCQNASLCVMNPTGLFFNRDVEYDEACTPGTYHWPEYVPAK